LKHHLGFARFLVDDFTEATARVELKAFAILLRRVRERWGFLEGGKISDLES
jgi:hypothetical protein